MAGGGGWGEAMIQQGGCRVCHLFCMGDKMYSNTTRLAPQVTYAKHPVKAVSIYQQMNWQAGGRLKGAYTPVTYVPG